MAYAYPGDTSLDYYPCRYGQSKLLFRGPRRRLEGDYCAVIGGTETYGKFIERPFAALAEEALGLPVVNFGYLNAGVDVFVTEAAIIEACAAARVTVIQLMGAQNMSNRFYAVHPRRNDRFLRASALMKTIFPEVDFTEFHFTRHMLSRLKAVARDKFALVEDELRSAWVARMRTLLQKIPGEKVLLWLEDWHAPGQAQDPLGPEPLLVDGAMVAEVRGPGTRLLRVAPSGAARLAGTEGMCLSELDQPAASQMPGPRVHAEIADALVPAIRAALED